MKRTQMIPVHQMTDGSIEVKEPSIRPVIFKVEGL